MGGKGGRPMTRREALQVLIKHAAADCNGAGTGIRTVPDRAERERVREAVKKLFREAYGREMDDSDAFNLKLG
jgi:hypothetical protein